jgi:integrase/DNA-binding GntR family transcriptional regulator
VAYPLYAADSKRRTRQRGGIDELPSGAVRVRVYAGVDPVTKREHYLTETIPAGPGAWELAEQTRTKFLNQVNERRNPRTSSTVTQLLRRHLDQWAGERTTLKTYRRYVRIHVEPLVGHVKVGTLDADMLDSLYAELRRCPVHCSGKARGELDHRTKRPHNCDDRCRHHKCKPLGASSIRQIHFILSGAYKKAVRWRWVAVSPITQAEPPAAPKPNPTPPSTEDAARILNEAWKDPDWCTLVWLTMTTGARRGEQCGLRWKHVDLEHAVLTYDRSIGQDEDGTWEKDTKQHQQRRNALDPETVTVLAEHRTRCQQRAAALGIVLTGEEFVFSGAPDGSEHLKPASVGQRYGRLAARLGIKTSLHKLRHYSATELIKAGVDIRTVAGRLGHGGGGATTLRVYTAWVSEADQRASLSLHARMPARPAVVEGSDRALTAPSSPYEQIAAALYEQIAHGEIKVGGHLPTVKAIAATNAVSEGTATRAIALLKEWGLVEASRGRRAVVMARPAPAPAEPVVVVPTAAAEADEPQTPRSGVLLDLRLRHADETVRAFSARADPSDPDKLEQLLAGAVRRLGADADDLDSYELEVRLHGQASLVTTFVTTS